MQYVSLRLAIASPNTRLKRKLLNFVTYFPLPSRFELSLLSIAFQSTSIYGLLLFYASLTSFLSLVNTHVFTTRKHVCIGSQIIGCPDQKNVIHWRNNWGSLECFLFDFIRISERFLKAILFLLKLIFFSQQIQDVNFEPIGFFFPKV